MSWKFFFCSFEVLQPFIRPDYATHLELGRVESKKTKTAMHWSREKRSDKIIGKIGERSVLVKDRGRALESEIALYKS